MHILFIDESGTPPKPGHGKNAYFVIAGIVIPEDRWAGIREKLIGLKRRRRYRGEIKWRYFSPSNEDDVNPMKGWPPKDRNEFRREAFSIIMSVRSCKLLACVSESLAAYKLGNVNEQADIYFRTYKPVTERFQYLLQEISAASGRDTLGMIVADHRGKGDDDNMRMQHERLVRETGQYTSTYSNFVESLFFAPSHMSIGIQLADMVAGAVWRAQSQNDMTWYNLLRQSFRTSPLGCIDGYGIARFPKAGWTGQILK